MLTKIDTKTLNAFTLAIFLPYHRPFCVFCLEESYCVLTD